MIVHLWKSNQWADLIKFVSQNCRSRPSQFSRAHDYASDRIKVHLEQQEDEEKDNESAYMGAMQDMESARKEGYAAWYPEYEKWADHRVQITRIRNGNYGQVTACYRLMAKWLLDDTVDGAIYTIARSRGQVELADR